MVHIIFTAALIIGTLAGLIILSVSPYPLCLAGLGIILLVWTLFFLADVPYRSAAWRGYLAFGSCLVIISTLIAAAFILYLQQNPVVVHIPRQSVEWISFIEVKPTFIPVDPKISSMLTGFILSFFLTTVLFVVAGYLSSFYVLALHEEEMSFWQALKSFFFLIFNKQLVWLLVENGQVTEIKKQGFTNKWLSRGKIIIKPGNAIVTEKGGKITGIRGPGIVITTKDEGVREIFDLSLQSASASLENVITADEIPLTVEYSVAYRITPAANPAGPTVIKEKSLGVYPVERDTLHRAAFNGITRGWKGFGDNICSGRVRDQFMAHRIAEIFVIDPKSVDISIRVNERQIKKIEDAIRTDVNSFADSNMGITIISVDIKAIHLPLDVRQAIQMRLKSEAEARAIQAIETNRNIARENLVSRLLATISTSTGGTVGPIEIQLATEFAKISRRALTDDILGHQYIDMLKAMSEGDATKIFNVTPIPPTVEPESIPLLRSQPQNGQGQNGHNRNGKLDNG